MKKVFHLFIYLSICFTCYSQVGIGTTTPAGMLEVSSGDEKKLGLVVPIVAKLEDVRHVLAGETVKRGTTIFDEQRNTLCHRTINGWSCLNGDNIPDTPDPLDPAASVTYIKASAPAASNSFGSSVSFSDDGNILAVGATGRDSSQGAVYIFTRSGATWTQQAILKASNAASVIAFGTSVSLSGDGTTLAVGATDNVYIFTHSGSTWTQQTYFMGSNTKSGDNFGSSVSLSINGNTLAVGARNEGSNATGVDGDQLNTSALNSGAVYVFTRSGSTWTQQAYIKASNTDAGDNFGYSVSLSNDGNALAVGAVGEKSNAPGINGNQFNNDTTGSGAAYVFIRIGTTWSQQVYIKPSYVKSMSFGYSVSFSGDKNTLAVGAYRESSNATGVNGDQVNTSANTSGAVYIFVKSGTCWSQQAFIKASNTTLGANFGFSVSLSKYGDALMVGSYLERSNATGINGNQTDTSANNSGAAYFFTRNGTTWSQQAYLKSKYTNTGQYFGRAVSISGDGNTVTAGAIQDSTDAIGVEGTVTNIGGVSNSGSINVYKLR